MFSIKKLLGATIKSLIVAFLFIIIFVIAYEKTVSATFETIITALDTITVSDDKAQGDPIFENGVLVNYPAFGSKYAQIKIESIGLDMPVYYGANYTILKSGIAHDDISFFPGQGGSVIMAGHNFSGYLDKLPNTNIGDKIILDTNYGTFTYEIYEQKIVKETAVDEVPVQTEKEILMLYTCWPIHNIGHAYERYVVYANLMTE